MQDLVRLTWFKHCKYANYDNPVYFHRKGDKLAEHALLATIFT